jgi:hypothetical protein
MCIARAVSVKIPFRHKTTILENDQAVDESPIVGLLKCPGQDGCVKTLLAGSRDAPAVGFVIVYASRVFIA